MLCGDTAYNSAKSTLYAVLNVFSSFIVPSLPFLSLSLSFSCSYPFISFALFDVVATDAVSCGYII